MWELCCSGVCSLQLSAQVIESTDRHLSIEGTHRPTISKVPQAQFFSSSTAVRESGSAVAVLLASRQIASAVGGNTETPAG
ncbi:hypothetical protein NQZ68_020999 [Dissostichus eleginoides]|nr:hypothetical protein NQZ68_020999 [Dissostichus eleginoides]